MGDFIDQAWALYEQKAYVDLNNLCYTAQEAGDEGFEVLFAAGLAACRLGDPVNGARFIKRACGLDPRSDLYTYLAPVLKRMGCKAMVEFWESQFREYRRFKTMENFVVSYPKCGRTWIRLVLGKYALGADDGDPLELTDITRARAEFPATDIIHDDYPHWKPGADICTDKSLYADKRVAFLVRDPRDTLVSYFFQYTRRGDKDRAGDGGFSGDHSDFIRHAIGGLECLVGFYNVWAANSHVPKDFKLFRYEDFRADPTGAYADLIAFLDFPDLGSATLADAVGFGDFDNMKALEQKDTYDSNRLKPPSDGDPEGFKVRRGKVGGYTDYLNADDLAYIDSYLNDHLDDVYAAYK